MKEDKKDCDKIGVPEKIIEDDTSKQTVYFDEVPYFVMPQLDWEEFRKYYMRYNVKNNT